MNLPPFAVQGVPKMIQKSRFFAMVVETQTRRCLKMKKISNLRQMGLALPVLAVSPIGLTFVEQLKQLIWGIF